jgi:glycosyltransferase involved in cell wall biosynthesis
MTTPLVSIVIPCFNQAHFLAEAIESALFQSHSAVEVLVVDDGSTDNTAAVAARFPIVRYIRQENRGLGKARNTGIGESQGEFLIFLDSDDRLLPNAAASGLRRLAERPECVFAWGRHRLIRYDGTPIREREIPLSAETYVDLLRGNAIGLPASVLYRRSVFEKAGLFDIRFTPCEDYELYLRIARRFPICHHSDLVAEYRIHGGSLSSQRGRMLRASLKTLRAQKGYLGPGGAARQAYRLGLASCREIHGRNLAENLAGSVREGRLFDALPGLLTLLRYDPRRMISLLQDRGAGRRRREGLRNN